jgi:hypothetical protein
MRDGDGVKLIVDSFNPLPQAVDFDFHPANGAMSVLGQCAFDDSLDLADRALKLPQALALIG